MDKNEQINLQPKEIQFTTIPLCNETANRLIKKFKSAANKTIDKLY